MNWYCVHTRPGKEGRVASYLRTELGLETYFPRLKQRRTIRRVRREVVGPLFSRYLFCRFDPIISLRAVRFAPDALGIVSFGQQPAAVDDALIQGLKAMADDSQEIFSISSELRAGDQVSILDGPMRGLHAVLLEERDDRERVTVLLALIGGTNQRILIDRSQLALVA